MTFNHDLIQLDQLIHNQSLCILTFILPVLTSSPPCLQSLHNAVPVFERHAAMCWERPWLHPARRRNISRKFLDSSVWCVNWYWPKDQTFTFEVFRCYHHDDFLASQVADGIIHQSSPEQHPAGLRPSWTRIGHKQLRSCLHTVHCIKRHKTLYDIRWDFYYFRSDWI